MSELPGSLACFFDEKILRGKSMLVGGFMIPKAELFHLDRSIIQVKESLGLHETDPIKWNMGHRKCTASLRKLGRIGISFLPIQQIPHNFSHFPPVGMLK
jgi:hypothetical protein